MKRRYEPTRINVFPGGSSLLVFVHEAGAMWSMTIPLPDDLLLSDSLVLACAAAHRRALREAAAAAALEEVPLF